MSPTVIGLAAVLCGLAASVAMAQNATVRPAGEAKPFRNRIEMALMPSRPASSSWAARTPWIPTSLGRPRPTSHCQSPRRDGAAP
jgi:hypothetical protein